MVSLPPGGIHPNILNIPDVNEMKYSREIELLQQQLDELKKQSDLYEKEATSAKIESKRANILSIVSILIAIAAFAYEIISNMF